MRDKIMDLVNEVQKNDIEIQHKRDNKIDFTIITELITKYKSKLIVLGNYKSNCIYNYIS